jgi:hypothetical protein
LKSKLKNFKSHCWKWKFIYILKNNQSNNIKKPSS